MRLDTQTNVCIDLLMYKYAHAYLCVHTILQLDPLGSHHIQDDLVGRILFRGRVVMCVGHDDWQGFDIAAR